MLVFTAMFTMPRGYGQSINGANQFASSASVVYLNGNPKAYLEDSEVRFFANFKVKYVPLVVSKYEESDEMEVLMRNKYRHLNTNILFNGGVAIDVSEYSKKEETTRAWRDDFTFLENLFVDLLFRLLPN